MFKVMSFLTAIAAIALFSSCASSGASADPAREAEAAARAALSALDSSRQSGIGTGGILQGTGLRPAWVDNPDIVYPRSHFITAVGHGPGRAQAEADALARIVGIFGQAVQAELHIITSYSEAIRGGVIQVSEDTAVQNAITTSAQMDTLVGAEISDHWHDVQNNIHFAIAVMENERTSILYANLIRSNERIISDLVNMPPPMRDSLDGFARYRLAATIADVNRIYANVLTFIGNTRGINPAEMQTGDDFRIAAADVMRNIPIGVVVTGDENNRIRNAFDGVVTRAGFRSGTASSRYVLRVSYYVGRVDLPGQPNQFVRFELSARLENAAEGNNGLFAHPAMVGREGHLTVSEAEQRALRAAEQRIVNEFEPAFRNYLDNLIVIRRN